MGILIGELVEISSARFGYKIRVKHLPDSPIFLSESLFKQINKRFQHEFSIFNEYESTHFLFIATFFLTPSGNPQIESISFMNVDENWLPVESINELELINNLVTDQLYFIKCMRYNLSKHEIMASVLQTNTGDKPIATYLVPAGAGEDYYENLSTVVENSEQESRVIDINKGDLLKGAQLS